MRYVRNSSSYFAFIHSYLNCGNVAWPSTRKTCLSILLRHQKHASRVFYLNHKYTDASLLMNNLNALNIYQLNIYQILFLLVHKVKHTGITNVFKSLLQKHKTNTIQKASKTTLYKRLVKTKLAL